VRPINGVRMWQQDDPTSLILYQQIRQSPSKHEYQAILRAARVLRRMGLWLLAADLMSTWTFKTATQPAPSPAAVATKTNGVHYSPLSTLDDFTSPGERQSAPDSTPPTPTPVLDEKAAREAKAAELLAKLKAKKAPHPVVSEKVQPTQFKEPDANSLLDSFGF